MRPPSRALVADALSAVLSALAEAVASPDRFHVVKPLPTIAPAVDDPAPGEVILLRLVGSPVETALRGVLVDLVVLARRACDGASPVDLLNDAAGRDPERAALRQNLVAEAMREAGARL